MLTGTEKQNCRNQIRGLYNSTAQKVRNNGQAHGGTAPLCAFLCAASAAAHKKAGPLGADLRRALIVVADLIFFYLYRSGISELFASWVEILHSSQRRLV